MTFKRLWPVNLKAKILTAFILMSVLMILSGLFGYSLISGINRAANNYNDHIKHNELVYQLNMNILYLESSAKEYIISGDPAALGDFNYRMALVKGQIKQAEEQIPAPQVQVLIIDLKKSVFDIAVLFRQIQNEGVTGNLPALLESRFSYMEKNLETAGISMKLNSDRLEKNEVLISKRSLSYVLYIIIIEIIAVIFTGLFFVYLVLPPIRNLQTFLYDIIDSMPSVLIGVFRDGRVALWNDKAEGITGLSRDDAIGKRLKEVYPLLENDIYRINEFIDIKKVVKETRKSRGNRGEVIYQDITVYPLSGKKVNGAVIRIDDVTERVRMEELMVQSEKMLSLGGLAAGIAHEINNPLAGVIQTSELIQLRLVKNIHNNANLRAADKAGTTLEAIERFMEAREITQMLGYMHDSGRRIASLVSNMLSFSRKEEKVRSSYSLSELIDTTLELAASDYNLKKHFDFKNIKIYREYGENIASVFCEGSKIQQVLLNIFRNGAEAMQSSRTESPHFYVRLKNQDSMIVMEIEDNGPGIDEMTRKRIFDPFFTTKPVGEGTGLGLSVSYFIITNDHKGSMTVESSVGFGTKFIIGLPAEAADFS